MKVSIGAKTDIGRVRKENEDSYYMEAPEQGGVASESMTLLVVADGMGGHVAGKEASETAVNMMKKLFNMMQGEKKIDNVEALIASAFHEANREILKKGKSKKADMGTTMTAAVVTGKTAHIGHVGDSRAYQIRDRDIKQLTEDHNLAAEMVRKGKATWEETQGTSMRSMLTRAVGTAEEADIDTPAPITLHKGDVLLLCTDGLTNLVNDEEILSAVHNTPDVQTACDKLVETALERGGNDNITVVAAEFGQFKRKHGFSATADTVPVKIKKKKRWFFIALSVVAAAALFLGAFFLLFQPPGKSSLATSTVQVEIQEGPD